MKSFFASLLGSLVGMFLFAFLAVLLFVGMIGAMAALGEKPVTVPKSAYLVFDLSADIHDGPRAHDPFAVLVDYALPPLGVEFEYLQVFPVWGPLAGAGVSQPESPPTGDTYGFCRSGSGKVMV